MIEIKIRRLHYFITGIVSINKCIYHVHLNNITDIINTCSYHYNYESTNALKDFCEIHDYCIDDGSYPNDSMIKKWIQLTYDLFYSKHVSDGFNKKVALIYCVSGLGRAPLFVCMSMIICEDIDPLNAIKTIRKYKNNSLNKIQVNFLLETKWKKYKKIFKKLDTDKNEGYCCKIL